MSKLPSTAVGLLKQAERLRVKERAIKRERIALARALMSAAHELAGDDLESKPRPKRRPRSVRKPSPQVVISGDQAASAKLQSQIRSVLRPPRSGPTWIKTMLKILEDAGGVITYADLKAAIRKSHLGPRLAKSEKSFYGSLGKLEKLAQAVRHRGQLYSTAKYQEFMRDVAAGHVKDAPARNRLGQQSPAKTALLEYLEAHPSGGPSAEIIRALAQRPDLDLTDKNKKTAVYNLIGRLIERKELTKENGIVRLKRRANGLHKDEGPAVGATSPSIISTGAA
jgi:hypothetical protein